MMLKMASQLMNAVSGVAGLLRQSHHGHVKQTSGVAASNAHSNVIASIAKGILVEDSMPCDYCRGRPHSTWTDLGQSAPQWQ